MASRVVHRPGCTPWPIDCRPFGADAGATFRTLSGPAPKGRQSIGQGVNPGRDVVYTPDETTPNELLQLVQRLFDVHMSVVNGLAQFLFHKPGFFRSADV